jgi:hypothetical protein
MKHSTYQAIDFQPHVLAALGGLVFHQRPVSAVHADAVVAVEVPSALLGVHPLDKKEGNKSREELHDGKHDVEKRKLEYYRVREA